MSASKSTEPGSRTSALPDAGGEASEVVLNPRDLSGFKSSVNLMQKKSEVERAVSIESMSLPEGRKISAAAFEAYWSEIPEADRREKSAEELRAHIMTIHSGR